MARPSAAWADEFYRFGIALFLVTALALLGGASRYDEDQQMFVRLAALLAIGASLWPLDFAPLRQHRRMLVFSGLAFGLVLVQLVPLPPGLWAALPGHAPYARIAEASGTVGWRPLSLTPDLTVNAAQALLVPGAAALVALYLNWRARFHLFHWLIAAACLSALLGMAQLGVSGDGLRLFDRTTDEAPVGLFANRNHQAALLACALVLAAAVTAIRLGEGAGRARVLAAMLPVTILLLVMLMATGSRMGLVLGVLALAGAAACWRAGGQPLLPPSPKGRMAAVGIAALILALTAALAARSGALERLAAIDFADETRALTFAPMVATAEAFMPWGAGFGSFESVYRRFEPDALLSTIYMNAAHNEVLQLAIEGGLAALALLGLFCWWWGRTATAILFAPASRHRTLAVAAVVVTLLLMAASLVDYPLRTPLLSALFAIACVEMARASRRAAAPAPDA